MSECSLPMMMRILILNPMNNDSNISIDMNRRLVPLYAKGVIVGLVE